MNSTNDKLIGTTFGGTPPDGPLLVLFNDGTATTPPELEFIKSRFAHQVEFTNPAETVAAFSNAGGVVLVFMSTVVPWQSFLKTLPAGGFFEWSLAVVSADHEHEVTLLHDIGFSDVTTLREPVEDLLRRIDSFENEKALRAMKKKLLWKLGSDQFVGESATFRREIGKLLRFSQLDTTVLISGETGTGKESVARAIHYLGRRSEKPFVPVNCGSIPDHLFENELFGHERGAFTDAYRAENGLVRDADGGTLFLDEINTLSMSGQAKLLRFVEEKKFKPLGSSKYINADIRIIAATNVRLQDEVREHRFREDLFYRINLLAITLPPLRMRGDDIGVIATHYLKSYASLYSRGEMHFSNDAMALLLAYPWPGNIRELTNVIERAVIEFRSNIVAPADLDIALPDVPGPQEQKARSFRNAKREFELEFLRALLEEANGNITRAAKAAGKDRRSFQRLLRKYGIGPAVPA